MQNKIISSFNERAFLIAFFAITFLLASTFALIAFLSVQPPINVPRLILLTVFAHILYGAALLAAYKALSKLTSIWVVLTIALGLRLILVPSLPVFSDDIYRYVWDGKVMISGQNPYSLSPEEAEATFGEDPYLENINHRELKTPYPPIAQVIFAAIAFVCPFPTAFKLMSARADLGIVVFVVLLSGGRLSIKERRFCYNGSEKALMAGLAYGLNPLCCIETGMSGHLEPFAVLPTLAAILLLVKGKSILASFFLGIGAGIKLIPVFLMPLVTRKRVVACSIFCIVVIGLYLPFMSAGLSTIETLDTLARRWEGNSGVFAIVKSAVKGILGVAYGVSSADEMVHVKFLDPVALALQDTFFSLHKDGGFDPNYPGKFSLADLSLAVTKLIMTIAFSVMVVVIALRRIEPKKAVALILGTFLIITPLLHPWYLIWILPLAAVLNLWPWMVLSALSTLAYLPLEKWWSKGIWSEPTWISVVEYGGFALASVAYFALKRKRKRIN